MSYHVVQPEALEFEERPTPDGAAPRLAADVTVPGGLEQSRARIGATPRIRAAAATRTSARRRSSSSSRAR